MNRKIQLFLALFLVSTPLWAQEVGADGSESNSKLATQYFNNVSPKAPSISSLGSFGKIPINYYTGLPEISLNLLSLTSRELSVNATLNYDATGIRVEEFSGPVGIKWDLNLGGYIVRELNGLPDEDPNVGYCKIARQTNSFQDLSNPTNVVTKSENNEWDTEPDEFTIVVNGRTIRFVLDKYGNPIVYPRQNVLISKTITSDKITEFIVTTEDGVKYFFGGSTEAIQSKKVETLTLSVGFSFRGPYTKVRTSGGDWSRHQFYRDGAVFDQIYDSKIKVQEFFNQKWFLKKIESVTGDKIDLNYYKGADIVYAGRPNTMRVGTVNEMLGSYSYSREHCREVDLLGHGVDCHNYTFSFPLEGELSGTPAMYALLKFPTNVFRENFFDPSRHFYPEKMFARPGSVYAYHNLITESSISLSSVVASTGSRIDIELGDRGDLPNGKLYKSIKLSDPSGVVVKKIVFNQIELEANVTSDFLWISEAFLLSRINSIPASNLYYANQIRNITSTQVQDGYFRKFVFEGIKPYNYYRLFLESIEDATVDNDRILLYSFDYQNREVLPRRTSTKVNKYGYFSSTVSLNTWTLTSTLEAATAKSYVPHDAASNYNDHSYGVLEKISYPTGGSTGFFYMNVPFGFALQYVRDFDEAGKVLLERELRFLSNDQTISDAATASQLYILQAQSNPASYYALNFLSSFSQTPYALTHGVPIGHAKVGVYHNGNDEPSASNGWELFEFYSQADYNDIISPVINYPLSTTAVNAVVFPFPKAYERDYLRGMVKSHKVFKAGQTEENAPLKEVHYSYAVNPYSYTPVEVIGVKCGTYEFQTSNPNTTITDGSKSYSYGRYPYKSDWVVMSQKREIVRDEIDPLKSITTITDLIYNPVTLLQSSTKTYVESNPSESIVTKTKYAADYTCVDPIEQCRTTYNTCVANCDSNSGGGTCLQTCGDNYKDCLDTPPTELTDPSAAALCILVEQRQGGTPVEVQQLLNNNGQYTVLSAVTYSFKKYLRNSSDPATKYAKPYKVWTINQPLAPCVAPCDANEYAESTINPSTNVFELDPKMRTAHTYANYDASIGKITSQISQDGTSSTYSWDPTGSVVTSHQVNGSSGQTTTYTHKPLVGPTSISDPNGIETYYEYDNHNRLKQIVDNDQKVVSQIRYHYSTQSDSFTATLSYSGTLKVGQPVVFTTESGDKTLNQTSYLWEFGDNTSTTTTTNQVSHTFTSYGNFTVKVTKSNPEYGSASASKIVTITLP